jgi:hypothetical protein
VLPVESVKKEFTTAELFNKFTKETRLPHVLRGDITLMSQLEAAIEHIRSEFE